MSIKPRTLIIGSVSGEAGKKTAEAVARGMAQRQCVALDMTYIRIIPFKGPNGRTDFLYEIQEGTSVSLADQVIVELARKNSVFVEIADGRYAEVENDAGAIITVTHEKLPEDAADVMRPKDSRKKMASFHGDAKEVAVVGRFVAATGLLSFLAVIGFAWLADVYAPDRSLPMTPHQFPIEALEAITLSRTEYVRKVEYLNGKFEVDRADISDGRRPVRRIGRTEQQPSHSDIDWTIPGGQQ